MGWSYRKSFGSGPFRINFSKSGISYSVGVKGARVNVGPRGTFVNLSSHGISYRRKISSSGSSSAPVPPQLLPVQIEEIHNIASANIEQLTDTDSKDFVSELTQKSAQMSYVKWMGIFPLFVFLFVVLLTSFSSKSIITQQPTDSVLARVTSGVGANIRKTPAVRASIVATASSGQTLLLIDSSNRKWLKVGVHNSIGYISRRLSAIEHVHHDQVTDTQLMISNPYVGYELVAGLIGFAFLIPRLKKKDKQRFEMELHYEMDGQFQQVYQQFGDHFAAFSRSRMIWQYLNTRQTNDFKRNAGAGKLIKRISIRGIATNRMPLRHFVTNVAIPYLKLSNLELYFLPERVLIRQSAAFAAVFYKNLHISSNVTRFVEEEDVPADAQVVDHTWRYVNKSGGPDRRFNNNKRLPVCAYSQYTLASETGFYEVITTSKQGAMDAFAEFLAQIGKLQSRMAIQ